MRLLKIIRDVLCVFMLQPWVLILWLISKFHALALSCNYLSFLLPLTNRLNESTLLRFTSQYLASMQLNLVGTFNPIVIISAQFLQHVVYSNLKVFATLTGDMSLIALRSLRYFVIFFEAVAGRLLSMGVTSNTHSQHYISSADFENMFKDSGYWDYVLLSTYDSYFRLYFVYTLLLISDYSIVEKASWRGVGFILWPLNLTLYLELHSLGEFMIYAFTWFITLVCILIFFSLTVLVFF